MLDQIKTYLTFGNTFYGIEQTNNDGGDTFYVTILKKRKKQLDVEKSFNTNSIEHLTSEIPKQQHCFFILNNNQVLTKATEITEKIELSKLAAKAFPNINLNDFYCEISVQGESAFVSICRKAYVNDILEKFKDAGITVIKVSFGNAIISCVSTFLNDDAIYSSNAMIGLQNGTIASIERKNNLNTYNYDINGLETSNYNLLSLSGALNIILREFNPITNFKTLEEQLYKTFVESRFFNLFFKTGLISILTILILNFFAFNFYFKKANHLKQAFQINESSKQNLTQLNTAVNTSQKMVDDLLKSKSSKSSFYVNSLIQNLPESVLLNDLNFQPILKRIKPSKPILVDTNSITISGESNNSNAFTKWLIQLESLNWINKVAILSYEDITNSKSAFSLKLNIESE
ncbi:general secretion pathway protein [Flavobacteriaceae bacterium MHTCC 0001]